MKNITVIGAGTMGNGIAHVFAQSGFAVNLVDVSKDSLDRGLKTIEGNLDRMIAKEKISEADKTATLNNITTFIDTVEAVKNADLVVEAATENLNLKLNIEYFFDFNYKNCVCNKSSKTSDWNAFHESSSDDEIGRNYSWIRYDR